MTFWSDKPSFAINKNSSLKKINPVYQLKDIRSRDWEFSTLRQIAQRYNCTKKIETLNTSQQNIERYRFAIDLQFCLDKISTINNREDRSKLLKLADLFERELSLIDKQIHQLENKLQTLENKRFSPHTQLNGKVLFILGDSNNNTNAFLGYEATLEFNSSFTGKDLLKVELEAKEIARLDRVTDTFTSRLGTDGNTNNLEAKINYQFPANDRITAIVGTDGVNLNDAGEILNPLSSSSRGAVSRFGRRNPATMRADGDAGIALRYEITDDLQLTLGYAADSDDSADTSYGFFNGSHSLFTQLLVNPTDNFSFAFAYVRAYEPDDDVSVMGATGSTVANEPFGDNAVLSDRIGVQMNWQISDRVQLGGWFGYTQARQKTGGDEEATILNGALTLAFPDLFAENNLGGMIIGIPPVVSHHDNGDLIAEKTAFHLEALYRIRLSDQVNLTPGGFIVINPDTEDGDVIWVGTVRTEFRF